MEGTSMRKQRVLSRYAKREITWQEAADAIEQIKPESNQSWITLSLFFVMRLVCIALFGPPRRCC